MKKKVNQTESNLNCSKNKNLIKRIEIENTPFTVIKSIKEKAFLTVGIYRIPEPTFDKIEDAIEYVKEKPWNLMGTIASIIAEETVKTLNNKNNE